MTPDDKRRLEEIETRGWVNVRTDPPRHAVSADVAFLLDLVARLEAELKPDVRTVTAFEAGLWEGEAERERLRSEVEQLRVQLAGCTVAALGYAVGENDCKRGDYAFSVAFEDVKNLHARMERFQKALEEIADSSCAVGGDYAHAEKARAVLKGEG